MKTTTNLGFKKPEASDYITPDAFNENADKLDKILPLKADLDLDTKKLKADQFPDAALSGAPEKETLADADSVVVVDSSAGGVRKRVLWRTIKKLFAAANHASQHSATGTDPVTPEDIGAVRKSGDTMTGHLRVPSLDVDADRGAGFLYGGENFLNIRAGNPETGLFHYIGIRDTGVYVDNQLVCHEGNMTNLGVAKIVTGSYVGTGVNGCSLTFNDVPKLVFVWGSGHSPLVWTTGMSECTLASGDTYTLDISLSDKTLSWAYNATGGSNRPYHSLNSEGKTYGYAAFY